MFWLAQGSLIARVVEVGDTTGYVECVVKAHNMLAAGAARDKCSPFLVVSRYCPPAGEWETIHRTAKLIGQVRNRRQRISFLTTLSLRNDSAEPGVLLLSSVLGCQLDPRWPRFEISLHRICMNDHDTYLRIEVRTSRPNF